MAANGDFEPPMRNVLRLATKSNLGSGRTPPFTGEEGRNRHVDNHYKMNTFQLPFTVVLLFSFL